VKFDLHCHTREGSIDSKVPLTTYVTTLKEKGYSGMMITDHDSYKGCQAWDKIKDNPECQNFTVIKGIEYDTRDAGHFLVIMPDGVELDVLCLRGMKLKTLIKIVHHYGGILGPAHPYGVRCSSAMLFKTLAKEPHLVREFDFIETFNTCESPLSNILARKMALKFGKPGIGGTDAHEEKYLGMAHTEIDANITCNNDMISAILAHRIVDCGGTEREFTRKAKMKESKYAVWGFKLYNLGLGALFSPYRGYKIYMLAI
jgi:predicted metal-dependent phosphoesterase TrpH